MLLFSASSGFKYVLVRKQGSGESNSRPCTGYIVLLFILLQIITIIKFVVPFFFCFWSERKLRRFICLIIIVINPGVRQKQSNCHSDDCSKQQALHATLSAASLFLALGSGILLSTLTQMIQRQT